MRRIIVLAVVALSVVQTAGASEGTLHGIIKRVDDRGFELDIVQTTFPQYYESRLPAIGTGIRDGVFYQCLFPLRYESLCHPQRGSGVLYAVLDASVRGI